MAEKCPFCAIARSEDDSVEVVCEAADWIAFFPDEPATPGHTLVIPRAHVPDLWSLDQALAGQLTIAVLRVGRAIKRALDPEGMNLISSSGDAAGQTVFHLHLHVVPRWERDDFGRIWPPEKPMEEKLKDDLAERIRQECARS
jgi:histidine triad (HIT) family protein